MLPVDLYQAKTQKKSKKKAGMSRNKDTLYRRTSVAPAQSADAQCPFTATQERRKFKASLQHICDSPPGSKAWVLSGEEDSQQDAASVRFAALGARRCTQRHICAQVGGASMPHDATHFLKDCCLECLSRYVSNCRATP